MTSSMIDRIAAAICGEASWDPASDSQKHKFRAEARAALAAMREPTEPMREAAMHADFHRGFHDDDYAETFQIMIDAALVDVAAKDIG